MTMQEAIHEMTELELAMPPTDTGRFKVLGDEMADRLVALHRYVFEDAPAPPDTWTPSVAPLTAEEKAAHARYWMEH